MKRIYVEKKTKRVLMVLSVDEEVINLGLNYLDYEVAELPEPEEKPLHTSVLFYSGKKFTVKYELDRNQCYARINELNAVLASNDYKVVQSAEYQLMGKEPKYDINGLHQQRQELRDEINRIKSLLHETV